MRLVNIPMGTGQEEQDMHVTRKTKSDAKKRGKIPVTAFRFSREALSQLNAIREIGQLSTNVAACQLAINYFWQRL